MTRKKNPRKLVRRQHYLFEDQAKALAGLYKETGIPAAQALRDALDLYLYLRDMQKRTGLPVGDIIRRAIDSYLKEGK